MNRLKNSERGYVTAITALMLIPLMIMAALAVDVGSWYAEAGSVQTAADASALAAVPYLPDMSHVVAAALDEAKRNGYVDVDGHSQSTFDTPTQYPQILVTLNGDNGVRVQIKTEADAQFGRVVMDSVVIERAATSNFVRPVEMGNPSSQLGGGHLLDRTDTSNAFWLVAFGYCGQRANGTRHFVGFENTRVGCPNTPSNHLHRRSYTLNQANNPMFSLGGTLSTWGITLQGGSPNVSQWYPGDTLKDDYFVRIELPTSATSVSYDVDIYRPGACTGLLEGYFNSSYIFREGSGGHSNSLTNPQIVTRLFNADDTQADRWDSIVPGNYTETLWSLDDCNGDDGTGWYTIGTVVTDSVIRKVHYLSYGTREDPTEYWLNAFALRVVPTGNPAAPVCVNTAIPSPCPTIAAVDNMPILIRDTDEYTTAPLFPVDGNGNPSPVSFYLGSISDEHAGKNLVIRLFDAGEGMSSLEILKPDGTPATFDWSSNACADTGFCGAGGNGADNAGATGQNSLDVTNDRLQNNEATITIPIPNDYVCGSDCWWRVRYNPSNQSVHDVTEWSLTVTGDPIRLSD